MHILVTGGTGYIGSHTVVELLDKDHQVTILDNLSTSHKEVLERIQKITGKSPAFEEMDLCDREKVLAFFRTHRFDAVIHFAAFKAVGESVEFPLRYYRNNLISLINLVEAMQGSPLPRLVFSSSCSIYGEPDTVPVSETTRLGKAASPYGNTKQIGEEILQDVCCSPGFNVIALRYFNPAGAHDSAFIGEFPIQPPSNLVPVISETASGKRKEFQVYGNDYHTPDGTCIRDYIHVVDVAKAHVTAIERLAGNTQKTSFEIFNLGTGKGFSVMEVIRTFEKATGIKLNYKLADRRPGDVAQIYADTALANQELRWKTEKTLEDILLSAWKWEQEMNKKNS